MDTKCLNCGLVNWQGASVCKRCNWVLGQAPPESLNPFENEAPKSFSVVRLGLMLGGLLFVGFVAYQFVKVDPPKQAPISQTDIQEQQKMGQMMMEAQKADMQKMAKQQQDFQKMGEALTKPTFNKDLMQKSAQRYADEARRNNPKMPYVPPGGFGPPGAGVPYHTR